jgi:Notch-like protein
MWADVFTIEDDVNLMFNNFLNAYLIIFNHSFPYIKHSSKQYNKTWITKGIRISFGHKRELHVLSRNTDNPELLRYYKKYCKMLSDIKLAKKHYYNKLIINSKNKVKTTWGIIKSVTNAKSSKSTITSISSKRKSYNNPQIMPNIFNNYFIMRPNQMQLNKLTIISNSLSYLSEVHKRTLPNINLTTATSKEIKDIIKTLKWKNSKGYDEVPLNILKISTPFISSPLVYICNKSLSLDIFPTQLKYSQINPIFRKDQTVMSNYRPLSLLTSFSKIFEKVIFNRNHKGSTALTKRHPSIHKSWQ